MERLFITCRRIGIFGIWLSFISKYSSKCFNQTIDKSDIIDFLFKFCILQIHRTIVCKHNQMYGTLAHGVWSIFQCDGELSSWYCKWTFLKSFSYLFEFCLFHLTLQASQQMDSNFFTTISWLIAAISSTLPYCYFTIIGVQWKNLQPKVDYFDYKASASIQIIQWVWCRRMFIEFLLKS